MTQAIKISKAGKNVQKETNPNNLIFDSTLNTFKILAEGTVLSQTVSGNPTTINIPHGQSSIPAFNVFVKYPDGYVSLPAENDYSLTAGGPRYWLTSVDATNIKIKLYKGSIVSSNTGYNKPGIAATEASNGGTLPWANWNDALSSNNVYATATHSGNDLTERLKLTSYYFSVPSDATIVGVEAEIELNHDYGTLVMDEVKLVVGGSVTGNNKTATFTVGGGTDETATAGGATDMWGTSLTPAQVNANNFGIVIANDDTTGNPHEINTDVVKMKVYYTQEGANYNVDIKYYVFETPAT